MIGAALGCAGNFEENPNVEPRDQFTLQKKKSYSKIISFTNHNLISFFVIQKKT